MEWLPGAGVEGTGGRGVAEGGYSGREPAWWRRAAARYFSYSAVRYRDNSCGNLPSESRRDSNRNVKLVVIALDGGLK